MTTAWALLIEGDKIRYAGPRLPRSIGNAYGWDLSGDPLPGLPAQCSQQLWCGHTDASSVIAGQL